MLPLLDKFHLERAFVKAPPPFWIIVEKDNSRRPVKKVAAMTVTVKLDEQRKKSLDKFLASLLVEEGIKVTLQEALGLMVDYTLENQKEFVKKLKGLPPLEEDPAWKMLHTPDDWGVADASEKIDEYLYGK